MRVENVTERDVYAPFEGKQYTVKSGSSIDVPARVALSLAETDGLTVARSEAEAELVSDGAEALGESRVERLVSPMEDHGPGTYAPDAGALGAGRGSIIADPMLSPADQRVGAAAEPGEGTDTGSGLKGAELDAALEERGLVKTGTADEKRARVAQYDAEQEASSPSSSSSSGASSTPTSPGGDATSGSTAPTPGSTVSS